MQRYSKLTDLLVATAIIAILGTLFSAVSTPAQQNEHNRLLCQQHFLNISRGVLTYAADWDNTMVQTDAGCYDYQTNCIGWGFGRPDIVWPEKIVPYARGDWHVFRCPTDKYATDAVLSRDSNGNRIKATDPNLYYYWGERSDFGLNYDFLSPWVISRNRNPTYIGSIGQNLANIAMPPRTLLGGDSIWDRNSRNGEPFGGGTWTAEAPCVRYAAGSEGYLRPMYDYTRNGSTYIWQNYGVGWMVD